MIKRGLILALFLLSGLMLSGATVVQSGFQWVRFGGSTQGLTQAFAIALDSAGNSYVAADLGADFSFDKTTIGGSGGAYLLKFNTTGQLVWSLKLGGGGLTQAVGREVVVTSDGNIVVAGYYQGTGTIAGQSVSPQGTDNSLSDLFLLKVRPDATVEWVVTQDTNITGGVVHHILSADPAGNIYVHTYFNLDVVIGGETFIRPEFTSGYLISRYNSVGQRQWTRQLTYRGHFASGPNNELYYAFSFGGTFQWGTETFTSAGGSDVIVSRLATDGSVLWAVQGGGSGTDTISSFCTDSSGNLYLSGASRGSVQFGGTSYSNAGTSTQDAYIVSLNNAGSMRWLNAVQGTGDDVVGMITADSAGNLHAVCSISSGATSVVDGVSLNASGSNDFAVLTLDTNGDLAQISQSRGVGYETSSALAVGADNLPVVCGVYQGNNHVDGFWGANYSQQSFLIGKTGARRAPTVSLDPQAQTQPLGGVAKFTAGFDASPPFTIQWKKNGTNYLQTSDATLTISGLTVANAGAYSMLVSNDLGSSESAAAVLTVAAPPAFQQGPAATNVWDGDALRLGFTASSTQPYSVQWYRDSVAIIGATASELVVSNINIGHEGTYSVTISNAFGVNSASALVRVNFIPITSHRDMVHDPVQNMLYISAGSQLNRFNLTNRAFISPIFMLGQLYGMDLSEDYRVLALANNRTAGLTSHVFTVTFDVPTKTNAVPLVRTNGLSDIGTRSVAFGHGYNLVATLDADNMPAFWAEAESRASTMFSSNYHSAYAVSGAGRNVQGMVSTKVDPGQYYRLDANNKTQTLQINNVGAVGTDLAMSRDGLHTLLCRSANVFDSSGGLVASLLSGPGFPLGAAYHPQSNYVYCTWAGYSEIRVLETSGYTQVGTIPIGTVLNYAATAHPYAPGHLRISADGNQLFCSLPDGVRVINLPLSPPIMLKQPVNQAKAAGASVTFTAQASLSTSLVYQWQKDGVDILNATNASFTIGSLQAGHAANYRVRASNSAGFVYSAQASLTVLKGDPQVVWTNPADITYGTLLGGTHLNATAQAAGSFAYTPASGAKLSAGNGQVLQVIFTPNDLNSYEKVTNTVIINVLKKQVTVSTSSTSRQYGLPNPSFALSYAGLGAGETEAEIDVLPVATCPADENSVLGTYPISISGGSDVNYSFTYTSGATLTVAKRVVSFVLENLTQTYTGLPCSVTVTTVPAGVPVVVFYSGVSTPPTKAGSYPVNVSVSGANYQGNTNANLIISKAMPIINWAAIAPITYGTALSAAQLNASSAVAGTLSYSQVAGSVFSAGTYSVFVIHAPTDTANYLRTTNYNSITVLPRPLSVDITPVSRSYAAANPTFTGTLNGLIAGDSITAQYSTTANTLSPVGTYAINPVFTDSGNRLSNYTVSTNGGVLTVTKAALTIRANDKSRNFGAANPVFNAQFTGTKNGDVIPVSFNTSATADSVPGQYPIDVSLVSPDIVPAINYTVTLQSGVLTIGVAVDQVLAFSPSVLSYTERQDVKQVDTSAFVTNVANLTGLQLKLRTLGGLDYERISILPQGSGEGEIDLLANQVRYSGVAFATVSGTGSGADYLVLEFSAGATLKQATDLLRRIAYINTSANPSPVDRQVEARLVNQSVAVGQPATRNINIVRVNDPPTVTWVSPIGDSAIRVGYPVTLEVTASDVDNAVSRVEFWAGGNKLIELTAAPYRYVWTPNNISVHSIKAIAVDASGESNQSTNQLRSITVGPAAGVPRFTIPGNMGEIRFDFTGVNGVVYDVEVSTDFMTWVKLTTLTAQDGSVPIVDSGTLGVNHRFYRLVPKP